MSGFPFKRMMLMLSYSLVLILLFASPQRAGQAEPFQPIEEELSWLSLQEDETFKELFALSQAVENLERENKKLAHEMDQLMDEIEELESKIVVEESRNEKTMDGLAQVLKTYQRMGPASYVEIILDADSPGDFLRRINLLKDLARNTRQLLLSIEESKNALVNEKEKQHQKLAELTHKQEQMEKSLEKVVLLREKMREYLLSLEKEREYYQEQLIKMQQTWETLKPFFAETIKKLAEIIERGEIPLDGMKTRIALRGIHGSIEEATFNEIIAGHPELPHVVFSFSRGQASLALPESHLVLEGIFVIVEKTAIMFQVTNGTFYGLPLDENTINELLQDNKLMMDFKSLIGSSVLRSIEIRDKEVELLIIPVLFQN